MVRSHAHPASYGHKNDRRSGRSKISRYPAPREYDHQRHFLLYSGIIFFDGGDCAYESIERIPFGTVRDPEIATILCNGALVPFK
jgi:hypothetical protein